MAQQGSTHSVMIFAVVGVAVTVIPIFLAIGEGPMPNLPILGFAALIIVPVFLLILRKMKEGAQEQARVQEIFRTGARATARIERLQATGWIVNRCHEYVFTLRVTPEGAPAYEREIKALAGFGANPHAGQWVSVVVNREDPAELFIDWTAAPPEPPREASGIEARLAELSTLHARGVISRAELDRERERVLASV